MPRILLIAALIALWLWALVDILKSDFKEGSTKIVWALVVLFLPLLGFVLYFLIGQKQKVRNF